MKALTRKQLLLLSCLTGVLLWAGWPAYGFPLLLLVAFCPLLIVEHQLSGTTPPSGKKRKSRTFFGHAYLAMLLWNGLTTWWVCNSTYVGGAIAILCNSLFMALVLTLFHSIKRKHGNVFGYGALIVLWLSFEYIHLNWQLSWPWLTLGFGFSNYVSLLQWYEYTGPLGGTLWILLCNLAVYNIIKKRWIDNTHKLSFKILGPALAIIIVPILISLITFITYPSPCKPITVSVVVVQPNIDPYNEKFNGNFQDQLNKMFDLADKKVDSNTAYLVFPETAIADPNLWENNFKKDSSIRMVWRYLHKHPNLRLVTGAESSKAYFSGEKVDEIDSSFNTAFQLDTSKSIQVYHKSKLVPGVEFMPFNKLLAPLGKLAFDLGGTSGTLGTQIEPTVFYSSYSKTTIAPAICYESIYGEYIGEYIKKGAQLIFVITNDGWWKDTPGYRQHLCYGAMLAAETRKQVVQCANTGFSGIINEFGSISQQTKWWEPAVIKARMQPSDVVTFYARYGDYPGLFASYLSILLIGFLIIFKIIRYFHKKQVA